ncbi:hypothetical protein IAU60_006900 [Kwoniella sp. DSM 27419]
MSSISSEHIQQGLQALDRSDRKRNWTVTAALSSIKAYESLSFNWNDVVRALPSLLQLLGVCKSLSVSVSTLGMEVGRPPTGRLAHFELDHCLTQLSAQGSSMLEKVYSNISAIGSAGQDAEKTVNTELLNELNLWLRMLRELATYCCENTAIQGPEQEQLLAKLDYAEGSASQQSQDEQGRIDVMQSVLQKCREDYKDILAVKPSLESLFMQQLEESLVATSTTAIAQGTSSVRLLTAFNRDGQPSQSMNMRSAFEEARVQAAMAETEGLVAELRATSPGTGKLRVNDPASMSSHTALVLVESLHRIIRGADSTRRIDWDAFTKASVGGQPSDASEAGRIRTKLEEELRNQSQDRASLTSQLVTSAVTEALAVLGEMSSIATHGQKPDSNSDIAARWSERINSCVKIMRAIKQMAASVGGKPPGSILFPRRTDIRHYSQAGASLAEQSVRSCTSRLSSEREMLQALLMTFEAVANENNISQDRLEAKRVEAVGADPQTMQPADVQAVLVQLFGFAAQLKRKVSTVSLILENVDLTTRSVAKCQVEPFSNELEDVRSKVANELAEQYNIFMRDQIFDVMVHLASSFGLLRDVGDMYNRVHAEFIAQGLHRIERMAPDGPRIRDDMRPEERAERERYAQRVNQELADFTGRAERDARSIVQKKQEERINTLRTRVNDLTEQLNEFPSQLRPSEPEMKAVILGRDLACAALREALACEPDALDLLIQPR